MASNRATTLKYRQLITLWLTAELGIKLKPRPYVVSLAQAFSDDYQPGHVWGLEGIGVENGITINTHHERDYQPGQQVQRARADAESRADAGPDDIYFSVQFRQGFSDPADSLVFTDLATLGRVLALISKNQG